MHETLIKQLDIGESYTVQNFNGDVLDEFYVPANKAGFRISITKTGEQLTIRRVN